MRGCALPSDRLPRRCLTIRLVALSLLTLLGSACEIEKAAIARPPAQLALHGMLSATAPSQVVLLEHTRTGSVQLIKRFCDKMVAAARETIPPA